MTFIFTTYQLLGSLHQLKTTHLSSRILQFRVTKWIVCDQNLTLPSCQFERSILRDRNLSFSRGIDSQLEFCVGDLRIRHLTDKVKVDVGGTIRIVEGGAEVSGVDVCRVTVGGAVAYGTISYTTDEKIIGRGMEEIRLKFDFGELGC